MFHPEFRLATPTGGDLLTELGVRPEIVREVTEDERAIRCPDRGAAFPERSFASLVPEPSLDQGLHEPGPDELRDPASSLSLAD